MHMHMHMHMMQHLDGACGVGEKTLRAARETAFHVQTALPTHAAVGAFIAPAGDGILSIAYTQKDLTTGQHYGMGSTTALPRLCDHALVFTIAG